ncbi:polysaccharide biosynthesis/export family protein [Planctomycetota bacterium]
MKKQCKCVRYEKIVFTFMMLYLLFASGCSKPVVSTTEQVRAFEGAGTITPQADVNNLNKTGYHKYIYRVVAGDVLEFQMPAILRAISSDTPDWLQDVEPYLCRVTEAGTITLPIIGSICVNGMTLTQIESATVDAYYPEYVIHKPAVVCKVAEHLNERVFAVFGLVNKPDSYIYPPNAQYNLMEALAYAGGVDRVADPRYVKVYRPQKDGSIGEATFRIDQEFLADSCEVLIKPGDVIHVGQTSRTRLNTFLSSVFRVNVGAYVRPYDF